MKRRGFLQFLGIGAAAPVIAAAAPKVEDIIAKATEPFVPPVVKKAPPVMYRAMTSCCVTTFTRMVGDMRAELDSYTFVGEDEDA